MTTESQPPTRNAGVRVLLGAMAASACLGVGVALLGAVTSGGPAAAGALVGTVVILAVFAFGAFSVELVSRLVPGLSVLVALLSYVLQLVLLVVVLLALDRAGAFVTALEPAWLAAAIIVGTFAWLLAQIVITMRLRLPIYDLPEASAR